MKIAVGERTLQCSKPGCTNGYTHRHHKGCETMWLKAFWHRRKQKKYKALKRRYEAFRKKDTVEICDHHHEEAHELYNTVIAKEVRRLGFRSTSAWTWSEAEGLMKKLRAYCDKWLMQETPGLPLRKFQR